MIQYLNNYLREEDKNQIIVMNISTIEVSSRNI